jgi:hypothetical protein
MFIHATQNPLPPPPPDFKPPAGKKTHKLAAIAIAAIVIIAVVAVGVYFFMNNSPNNGGNNNQTSSLPNSEWSITQVASAEISSQLYVSLGLNSYTFTPTSSDDSFLTLYFDLAPTGNAEMLGLQNIVLTIDGQ